MRKFALAETNFSFPERPQAPLPGLPLFGPSQRLRPPRKGDWGSELPRIQNKPVGNAECPLPVDFWENKIEKIVLLLFFKLGPSCIS